MKNPAARWVFLSYSQTAPFCAQGWIARGYATNASQTVMIR